jgi:TolB protein
MKKYRVLSLLVSIILVFNVSNALGKVYIDILSPSSTRLPILIPEFKKAAGLPDKKNLAKKMSRVITDDLNFTGFFRFLDPKAVDSALLDGVTPNKIKWDVLSIIGAEAIVTGKISIKAQGRIAVELRLFDALQGKLITGKKYEGKTENYRLIAHKFSNEIFGKLTGERSSFKTKIAFEKSIHSNKDIFLTDYDGANEKRITAYNSLTLSPAWSPDARNIAFTSYKGGNPDLYIKDIFSGTTRKISSKQGINISPAWSPDGKKIALTLSLNNGNSEIYIITLKDRKLERVTNNWATDVSPAWSPDSQKIAFVSSRSGNPHIYTLDLKTRKIKRLTYNGKYNTSPAWSPDGKIIAYTGLKNTFDIYIVSTDGLQRNQLTLNQGNNEDPSWSPYSNFLAFSSDRTGQKEIFIMRADGRNQKRITSGSGNKSSPAWSSN